ncbi:hypothetical protein EON65_20830 [archaeon]|nr:MAG: hypothetical protein EON65_20830 [archaeon]
MLSHLHFYLLSLVLVAFLPISLLKHSLPLEAHNLRGGILTNPSQSRVKKIAVLSIYIARSLPVWFNLFASTVESNKEYFDWFIFTMDDFNLRPSKPLPSNIIIITLTSHVLSHLLSMVDENYRAAYAVRNATHTARVRDVIQNIIREFPYALVEFKPALADIFHEYIKQYSHFAYADMDVLLGDWSILPWDKVFESYNFVSITFGDHYSLYLRGQMTIFQNTLRTRLLYRRCLHLTEFSTRGEKYMTASPHKWQLQSAEGCISWGAHEEGLSILYLPLQRSDAYKGGKGEGAVLVKDSEQDRLKLVYCQSLLPNISSSADTITHNILDIPSWNEMIRHGQRAQVQIGAKAASARCSYWIDPQYDVGHSTLFQ